MPWAIHCHPTGQGALSLLGSLFLGTTWSPFTGWALSAERPGKSPRLPGLGLKAGPPPLWGKAQVPGC